MFDLIVIGGGPAGSVAALLAARDGGRVALIDPGATPFRLEGLSPRLHGWLHRSGLGPLIDPIAIPANRISLWAGRSGAVNRELVVDRAALDRALRRAAEEAGAVRIRATAVPATGGARLADGSWLAGRMIVDARGRKALSQHPRDLRGAPTIAIGAALRPVPDQPTETRIMALDDGWLWIARIGAAAGGAEAGGATGWAQATLDAADPQGRTPPGRLQALLHDAVRESGAARESGLAGPPQIVGAPLVRDAAPVLPAPVAALDVIAIGDAAAAMDPLSGHGMFWAVSSALAATAVRRTLDRQDDAATRDLALRFLNQRQGEVYLRQARLGRDFLRAETARAAQPFWARRRDFPPDCAEDSAPAAAAVTRRIVVENGILAERDVLCTPHSPAGIAWLGPHPAADLFRAHQAGLSQETMAARFGAIGTGFALWLRAESQPPGAEPGPG